jgi:methyl coenzyme M reductase subunit C-like uncharacterized protein (methanogenesis marker protein 7)
MEESLSILEKIEDLDSLIQSIIPIDILVRNGHVVSAYRQGSQVINQMSQKNMDGFHKAMSRSLLKMRKGEQIDALNDIKSVLDSIKNDKNKNLVRLKELISNKPSKTN